MKVDTLREKLKVHWKDLGRWGVTSLGNGLYELSFSTLEDAQKLISIGPWSWKPCMMKLFALLRHLAMYNPSLQHNTSAQVWVKIYGGQKYRLPLQFGWEHRFALIMRKINICLDVYLATFLRFQWI